MGVQIVSSLDTRRLIVPNRQVPLTQVYQALNESIPTLDDVIQNVILLDPADEDPNEHDLFLTAALDEETANQILLERARVLHQTLLAGGVYNRRELYLPDPQITIAYLGKNASRNTIHAAYEVLDDHLPITGSLLPALKHPTQKFRPIDQA
jgi:hypothetical protein